MEFPLLSWTVQAAISLVKTEKTWFNIFLPYKNRTKSKMQKGQDNWISEKEVNTYTQFTWFDRNTRSTGNIRYFDRRK